MLYGVLRGVWGPCGTGGLSLGENFYGLNDKSHFLIMTERKPLIDPSEFDFPGRALADAELNCLTAEERQRYFEWLCSLDDETFRELWEKSEVSARWREAGKRLKRWREKEVGPVARARWVFGDLGPLGASVHCSNCGWGVENADPVLWVDYPGHKYCGACGARMAAKA